MKTQHMFSVSAAAVLAMTMAAFAQAPQSSSPSAQSGQQPSASSSRQPATQVTLAGCVMRESDYRKASDAGRGGPAATGLGLGNEFVLVNAMKTTAGASPAAASGSCSSTPAGEAYELTGSREKELASYVGRRVEITGTLKEAKTTPAPSGEAKPTGGFDPLKQDLKLFEVEVTSFREPAPGPSAAAAPAAAPAPESAPAPAPAPRAAAPAAPPASPAQAEPPAPSAPAAPRQQLPRTASPLPLTALIGLLSMATGLAMRRRG